MTRRAWLHRLGLLVAVVLVGIVASGCDWTQFLYGPEHTGFNSTETALTTENVGTLIQRFSGSTSNNVQLTTDPVVAGGIAYVGANSNGTLYAFSASATSGCTGTPVVCSALWTADVDPTHNFVSDAVVANGDVYVSGGNGTLSAFDAAGKSNCSGSPIVCSPLWTANAATGFSSNPVYANGVIYVTTTSGLEAFDAAGAVNCTGNPKVCSPLWTTSVQGESVSIANGIAYLADAGTQAIYALDATGTANCAGTPKVCSPLWQFQTDLPTLSFVPDYPVISGGTVFIATASPFQRPPAVLHYNVEAFDASGTTNCSGAPKMCTSLWTTSDFPTVLPPAVAHGNVYVTSLNNGLAAFDAGGVKNCSGTPVVCSPVWTSPIPPTGGFQTATIAGGVTFIVTSNHLYALDAAGQVGCSTNVCSPLWTSPTSSYLFTSDLVVTNGLVYVDASDGNLHVYGLP